MMDAGAVDAIARYAQDALSGAAKTVEVVDRGGNVVRYSSVKLYQLPIRLEAVPEPIVVHSLRAVVDYIDANRDDLDLATCMIHVQGPEEVAVLGPLFGPALQRPTYLTALFRYNSFPFGQWLLLDEFLFLVLSRFGDTPDRDALLNTLRRVTASSAITLAHDGKTQQVEVRKGISLTEQADLPGQLELMPFRTFSEVPQPTSFFVVRLRGGTDGTPVQAMLLEAEGDGWIPRAISNVATWLALASSIAGKVAVLG